MRGNLMMTSWFRGYSDATTNIPQSTTILPNCWWQYSGLVTLSYAEKPKLASRLSGSLHVILLKEVLQFPQHLHSYINSQHFNAYFNYSWWRLGVLFHGKYWLTEQSQQSCQITENLKWQKS